MNNMSESKERENKWQDILPLVAIILALIRLLLVATIDGAGSFPASL